MRPARVAIGQVSIRAASALEARRLADRLPAALERALDAIRRGPALPAPRTPADRAARAIALRIAEKLEAQP